MRSTVHAGFLVIALIYLTNVAVIQGSNEISLYKDGDYIIKVLLAITNSEGNLSESYAIITEVIRYIINGINANNSTLSQITLGYDIVNDKSNLNAIMKEGIAIVSKYRHNSICRKNEEFCMATPMVSPNLPSRIGAVIGPARSSASVPSASLLGLYNIPQISYAASSSILSDDSRFKSFLRTIPSDKYQSEAIVSFVKHFDWTYVVFIASDDEYGRQGLASFKMAARKMKVCTAEDVNIPFQRDSGTKDIKRQIADVVSKMKNLPKVRVAILFMFEEQAAQVLREAEAQGLKNVTWIFSDAIGPTIANKNISKEQLHGAFGIDFVSEVIPKIEKHLLNVTVEKAVDSNPWLLKLFEKKLNCSIKNVVGKRRCRMNEKFDRNFLKTSVRWSRVINVVNSILAIENGLDNLLKCNGKLPGGQCPNTSFPLNAEDVYTYIRNVSFKGALGKQVSFDEHGDLETKNYTFRNLQWNRLNDTIESRTVAEWSSLQPDSPKFIHGRNDLTWNKGKVPNATCSIPCKPGEKQVGESDCCWACYPCSKGEISNVTGVSTCYKCPRGWYANKDKTQCLKTEVDYIDSGDAFSIVTICIASIAIVAMLMVVAKFYFVRDTPLIQDSNPLLLGCLITAVILAFMYSLFQVTLYRTDASCRFLSAMLLVTQLLAASTLLAKTKTCDQHLRKLASHYFEPAAKFCSIIFVAAVMLFELFIIGIWFITDSPVFELTVSSIELHIRECSSTWAAARFIATGFPLLILFLATVFSFKERDDRKNHSEAKYISFCTISLCILLIAFFPTHRFAQGLTQSIVIATTSLVGGLAVTVCIILPKVYILLVKPHRNVPEEEQERTRSHNTTSSAHTANGSQHRSVFSEGDDKFQPTNDNEKRVVKDITLS